MKQFILITYNIPIHSKHQYTVCSKHPSLYLSLIIYQIIFYQLSNYFTYSQIKVLESFLNWNLCILSGPNKGITRFYNFLGGGSTCQSTIFLSTFFEANTGKHISWECNPLLLLLQNIMNLMLDLLEHEIKIIYRD